MRTHKNILIAFILNLAFSIFEFIGGTITNSVAIISDSIHDMGDAISIGIAYILEKKSKKKPDDKYTYGYVRYSIIGSAITTIILIIGSMIVIYNGIKRIIEPVDIDYNGMVILGIIGVVVNLFAVYFTKDSHSLNEKSVNLHMLEDVLGWIVVLIGAIIMRFTDIKIIDPILSVFVALFIFKQAISNFKSILDLFLEKIPRGISINELTKHLTEIRGVSNVHHIHIWSIDGYNNYATMHVIADGDNKKIKKQVKEELKKHGISHTTIEIENEDEVCINKNCEIDIEHQIMHNHHSNS